MKLAPIVALVATAQAQTLDIGTACTLTSACNSASAGACCAKFWAYMEATPSTLPSGWLTTSLTEDTTTLKYCLDTT